MTLSLPIFVIFSTALAISQGEEIVLFQVDDAAGFPAAASRSVCRERNAGICRTSATSAAAAA